MPRVTMTPLEAQLLAIRDALHGGSWEQFLVDLRERLNARPYNHALHVRIVQDIAKIEEMARADAPRGSRG